MVVAAFFATGFAFWALIVATFVGVLIFSENDSNFWAGGVVLAFAVVMSMNGNFSPFEDPLTLLMWAAAYFGIGAGWSVLKWFSYIHKRGDQFAKHKLAFIEKHNANLKTNIGDYHIELEMDASTDIPYPISQKFKEYLERSSYLGYGSDSDIIPNWRNNKERMTAWILYWPTSALWTILNDPLVRLAKWIYSRLGGVYDKLTQRVFGKFGNISDL